MAYGKQKKFTPSKDPFVDANVERAKQSLNDAFDDPFKDQMVKAAEKAEKEEGRYTFEEAMELV